MPVLNGGSQRGSPKRVGSPKRAGSPQKSGKKGHYKTATIQQQNQRVSATSPRRTKKRASPSRASKISKNGSPTRAVERVIITHPDKEHPLGHDQEIKGNVYEAMMHPWHYQEMAFNHDLGRAYLPYGKVPAKEYSMGYDPYRGHVGPHAYYPFNQYYHPAYFLNR